MGSGFRMQGLGFRIEGVLLRIQGSGVRVQGPGWRGQGLGQFVAQVSAVHLRWAQLGSFVDFGIRVRAHMPASEVFFMVVKINTTYPKP